MDLNDLDERLKADCENCAALCCVALAFDKSNVFPFDKEAGEPCRNLETCGTCRIHSSLSTNGYMGCVQFHCHGAGPAVTQELFSGSSWQNQPHLLRPMMEAFWVFLRLQEQVLLLRHAANLPLPDGKQKELHALLEELCPQDGWSWDEYQNLDLAKVSSQVKDWLASLREVLAQP
ncbi:hypothetical protein PsAD2_01069 [Pseudovibrio axinellae]|uniref:Pentapeptide repeats (8 copies) n=1 Tax=Pseudovibrio axinellae TaxID=989403 RepID=A0A166A383_9HYPH|nr:hypothetical protein [Pseudovibrio axinellae]KZL20583.1 hypothetical protein PsAD2_01069 [Pseudovibrio axinellae]SER28644.1 hypothetical protein SAMN05421798_107308 [Pseudovibrio axinellae]